MIDQTSILITSKLNNLHIDYLGSICWADLVMNIYI